jgi:adenosine deaminase
VKDLERILAYTIAETNGIALLPTLELIAASPRTSEGIQIKVAQFIALLHRYHQDELEVSRLLQHEVALCLRAFLKRFPLPYLEEHIHLTGSLSPAFVFPRLQKLINGKSGDLVRDKILAEYGKNAKFGSLDDVAGLMLLKDHERFARYLQILYLPKLILIDREAHREASYHMAKTLFEDYNVGFIRLKFTYNRVTVNESEKVVGVENMSSEDVVLGLYDGFNEYRKKNPKFSFVLSPCFRKEADFFDSANFKDKKSHFESQIDSILELLDKYPYLESVLTDIDTVGDEKELFRKEHFHVMASGFHRLQSRGFKIRSHHGETFHTLRQGIQSVDNAMNIWRIDTLEHGLSLGINPNFYYQSILEESISLNQSKKPLPSQTYIGREVYDMDWRNHDSIFAKLKTGLPLSAEEIRQFIKVKFHHAQSVESYQHDVLNRVLDKKVTVTALPSSNQKLTGVIPGFKDHPFSWWEKKGVKLGIGTDNYVTLGTDYIKEMLLLLFSEPSDLKITKLLMVATGETRRLYLSKLLWDCRKIYEA